MYYCLIRYESESERRHQSVTRVSKVILIVLASSELNLLTLVFLEDCKDLLSGGQDGMIRQWQAQDATEVGEAINAISHI